MQALWLTSSSPLSFMKSRRSYFRSSSCCLAMQRAYVRELDQLINYNELLNHQSQEELRVHGLRHMQQLVRGAAGFQSSVSCCRPERAMRGRAERITLTCE